MFYFLGKKRSSSKNIAVPLAVRKEVFAKFMRLRTSITKATAYRIKESTSLEEKINLLRDDINNAPSHVFGEHAKCDEKQYFSCNKENEKNLVPILQEYGIYADIKAALQRVEDNASSLVMNMDNNLAEHYNSVVCKFVGGKRVNFSLRGSYQTRCEAAALAYSSRGEYYRLVHKSAHDKSPQSFTKKNHAPKTKGTNKCTQKTVFETKIENRKTVIA